VDIHTNEHQDDIFDKISRFLEYRRVFISGKELKELYFDQINQQIARSRERYPEGRGASCASLDQSKNCMPRFGVRKRVCSVFWAKDKP
jgi:hypothetical protein